MPLDTYRARRRFGRSPEPRGDDIRKNDRLTGRSFVVQRHRARRLHYDFRLELGGVLVSWAVPRGPSLDPAARRLAVHVEDHPLEYGGFEGVIPAREYGAGDVTVWDRGRWWPEADVADPTAALAAGELKFRLEGEKLKGAFVLVRTGPARAKDTWLLIKRRDDDARPGWDAEAYPASVKSGRTNEELGAGHGWRPR